MMNLFTPRTATDNVFKTIRQQIADGKTGISLLKLAVESGYSVPTVQKAVRELERMAYIRVERGGPRRASRYELVPEDRRRIIQMGQALGLIVTGD